MKRESRLIARSIFGRVAVPVERCSGITEDAVLVITFRNRRGQNNRKFSIGRVHASIQAVTVALNGFDRVHDCALEADALRVS